MTVFSACIAQCGLGIDEAARILGQSREEVEEKASGVRDMVQADAAELGRLYRLIHLGHVAGLPQGVRDAAAALRLLRGAEIITATETEG